METNGKTGGKSKKKNISSEEIVERHLHDSRDVITTEDIENVKVPPPDEPEINDLLPATDEDSTANPEHSDSDKKDHITPWNVIDP